MLGEFEYLVLTSAVRLGEDAYGTSIRLEVERTSERNCSIGALYTTLDRLEAKGLIESKTGEATARRGGRPKRMVKVTLKGEAEAAAFYQTVVAASRGLAWERPG